MFLGPFPLKSRPQPLPQSADLLSPKCVLAVQPIAATVSRRPKTRFLKSAQTIVSFQFLGTTPRHIAQLCLRYSLSLDRRPQTLENHSSNSGVGRREYEYRRNWELEN